MVAPWQKTSIGLTREMAPMVLAVLPLAAHGGEFFVFWLDFLEFVPTVYRGYMRAEQWSFLLKSCGTVGPDMLLAHGLSRTSHALADHSRLQIREQRCFIDLTLPCCVAGAEGIAGV